jgi:Fe-S-cluster containining protein
LTNLTSLILLGKYIGIDINILPDSINILKCSTKQPIKKFPASLSCLYIIYNCDEEFPIDLLLNCPILQKATIADCKFMNHKPSTCIENNFVINKNKTRTRIEKKY